MSELSREARALMEQGSSDGPSAHDRERIKARLAAELGVGVFAAATVATAAGAHAGAVEVVKGTGLWLKGVASFVALTGGAAAIYVGLANPSASERAHVTPQPRAPIAAPSIDQRQPSATPAAPSTEEVEARSAAATVAPSEPAPQPRKARRARAVAPAGGAEPASASADDGAERAGRGADSDGDVQAELALLARAQRALREGKPEQALAAAREHAGRFANGALSEERAAIEAIATCRLGHGSAAAQAFLARSPASPLAARVRKECGSR